MSATTDRLDEMAALTAPLPWPALDFYGNLTGDQFQFLYALSQAWPMLRDEIVTLEATVIALSKDNAQLHAEHARVVAGSTQLARDLADIRERADRTAAESAEHTRLLEEALDKANGAVRHLPMRVAAAEAVCASINANKQGSGGAFGWYDGEAHDAWRAAR